jgi:aquaporin Z
MNKYLTEFLGTLFFVYVILASGNPLAIAAAFLLTILIIGPITGGHINPAVSISMVQAGKLPQNELLPYIASQIAGGLAALQIFNRV